MITTHAEALDSIDSIDPLDLFERASLRWMHDIARGLPPLEAMQIEARLILDGYANLDEADEAWEWACEQSPNDPNPFVKYDPHGLPVHQRALRQAIDFVGAFTQGDAR